MTSAPPPVEVITRDSDRLFVIALMNDMKKNREHIGNNLLHSCFNA